MYIIAFLSSYGFYRSQRCWLFRYLSQKKFVSRSSPNGYRRYLIDINRFVKMALHFNFTWIKSTYLLKMSKMHNIRISDFCASVQVLLGHAGWFLHKLLVSLVFVSGGRMSLSFFKDVMSTIFRNIFQHSVASYLAEKLQCCLQYLNNSGKVWSFRISWTLHSVLNKTYRNFVF